MKPHLLLCCLLTTGIYQSVIAQRNQRGRQRDASHQMPPGGMQGPPPGMQQEEGKYSRYFNLNHFIGFKLIPVQIFH